MGNGMNIGQLKARELREKNKAGHGVVYFCKKYSCTEQELEVRISQLYSRNEADGKKLFSSLKDNDLKKAKKTKSTENSAITSEADVLDTDSSSGEPCEDTQEETITVETATLEQLKELEGKLSAELMALESEHKAKAKLHRGCKDRYEDQKLKIEELEVALQNLKKGYLETVERNNVLAEEMNALSAIHKSKSIEIDKVRDRIKILSRVVLFVYEDGEIAMENSDIVLDETDSDELYRELMLKDECAELRARDIRVLAKVLDIYSRLPKNIEIMFDNAEIEGVFKLLSA